MSLEFEIICTECREGTRLGDVWYDTGPPSFWRIDFEPDEGRTVLEYFLLAHRGHVLGMVDEWAADQADDEAPITTTFGLTELLELHPEVDFDDAERLAAPGPLLERLLQPGGIESVAGWDTEDSPTA